jgi:DNA-binding NtrC family response regulator
MANRFHVLIVDDNAELVETFKDIFELKEFAVTCAANGAEAIAQARQAKFDIVLLDLVMPGMDGAETMKAIKQFAPRTRFIVVTAYDNSPIAAQAQREGALRMFQKPLVIEEVVDFLTRLREQDAKA